MNLVDKNVGSVNYDNLFNDSTFPVNTKSVELKPDQGLLVRGSVLGIDSTTGLAELVDSSKTGGIEVADSILTDDVDTSLDDVSLVTTAYSTGMFNRQALVFGGSDTASRHERTLRTLGIFMKDNLPY